VIVVILIVAAVSIRSQRASVVEDRLDRLNSSQSFVVEQEEEKPKEKKPSALVERIESSLQKGTYGSRMRGELAKADLKLTVTEFLMLHPIAAVAMGILCYFVLFSGSIIMAIVGGGVGLFIPRIYLGMKQNGRLHKFEEQLPDTLGLWVNSLRSGYSVMQALESISREAPVPTNQEIRRVVMEAQFGIPMEDALAHLLARMPSDDLDLVITAVNIQREVGGNLAEILEVISHTIRERIKLKGEIRVLTSQGRITGYVISGLPIVLAMLLGVINPSYVGLLFTDHCGWLMLAAGLILIGLGSAVINKIVDIEI
jgi:tight adherence protein B